MEYLGFSPCKSDADIWMRKAKRADNSANWEYVLLYVDDCLCISENPKSIVQDEIGKILYYEGSFDWRTGRLSRREVSIS